MSYAMWPSNLPQRPLVEGFGSSGTQPVVRQSMESGLDRVTRVSSLTERNNTVSFLMDNGQTAEFWDFYENHANAGADFVWIPLVTGNQVLMHVARISSYPRQRPDGLDWVISFEAETDEQQVDWS